MTKITKTIYCDLCGKEIKELPFGGLFVGGLFGDRFTVKRGIYKCKEETADICYDCTKIIRTKCIDSAKGNAE